MAQNGTNAYARFHTQISFTYEINICKILRQLKSHNKMAHKNISLFAQFQMTKKIGAYSYLPSYAISNRIKIEKISRIKYATENAISLREHFGT